MVNFIRNYFARMLAWTAGVIADLAIFIAGAGMVRIELDLRETDLEWDDILGAVMIFVGTILFWIFTP